MIAGSLMPQMLPHDPTLHHRLRNGHLHAAPNEATDKASDQAPDGPVMAR
jgi:hypothetical protein